MVEAPYLTSASTLIKALRGAADPPQQDWPSKAEIALAAWRDTSFHVPRKEDVLRDWVLDSWSRGQGAEELVHLVTTSMQANYSPTNAKKSASTAHSRFPTYCKAYTHERIRTDLNSILSLLIFHPTLSSPLPPLFSSIEPILPSALPDFLICIPDIFKSLVTYYHQQRYAIFTQASSSKISLDVFIATKEREAVRTALEQTLGFLDKIQSETTWEARSSIWAAVESWGGYMERDERWGKLVDTEARTIESLLSKASAPIGSLLRTLSILERLDHDQAQIGPDVVRWCLALTHTLHTFFDLLVSSLDGLFDESLPDSVIASLYELTIHGPITRYRLRHDITASLRSLQASKHSAILDLLSTRLRALIVAPERPSKKRKRDDSSDHASAMIGVLTRVLSYCLSSTPTEDLQDLVASWPEPSSDIARAGRLRVARCVERLSSRVILENFTLSSGATELQIESLDQLARMMRYPLTTAVWELPKLRGYIDRKTRSQIIAQIIANKQVVPFAPWLLQVADADTLATLSSDSKAIKHLAKSDEADFLVKIVNHAIKNDNVAVIEGIASHLKSETMIARFCEALIAHPVEKIKTVKPSLEKLYSAAKISCSTRASSEDIVRYNTNVRFGRWLGMQIDAKMGDTLLLRVRAEPEFAKIALETIASESDVERALAACVHIYETSEVDLASTVRSIITDVPEAITLCLAVIDAHASSVSRILKAIVPRCEDIALSRRATQAVLSQPTDTTLKISYFETLADEKPHALQHDDIAQLWAIALPITDLDPILNILSTLTRRRPELVLSTLPEVSDVLCATFGFLQTSRNVVGVNSPTGAAQAQAQAQASTFARLLTAMTSMRTSKTHTQAQTHETSPLAKYVPALLVAYVRAAAHPFKGLSPPVRKALEPGLYALCNLATAGGRINARGREGEGLGTPFGLGEGPGGEGEKELWAELWRGWSKARYVGQG
ncbi:hypothetical protein IAU59_002549 [Kwoniella sp. CBS 9459]